MSRNRVLRILFPERFQLTTSSVTLHNIPDSRDVSELFFTHFTRVVNNFPRYSLQFLELWRSYDGVIRIAGREFVFPRLFQNTYMSCRVSFRLSQKLIDDASQGPRIQTAIMFTLPRAINKGCVQQKKLSKRFALIGLYI